MIKMFKKWFNKETKSITGGAVILAISSLASRFLGILRDRILAGRFGAGDTLDIYYASFQIPDFFYNIFILGTLSVAFIPVFTSYIQNNDDAKFNPEALEFTNTILNLVFICMGIGCLVLIFFAPVLIHLVAPGFSGEKRETLVVITRIMLLSPFIFSLSSIFGSVLTSFKRFIAISFAPIFYNLGIIYGAIFLAPGLGVKGLALGVIFGAFLHLFVQLLSAKNLGFSYKVIVNFKNSGIKKFTRLFIPRILGVDISFASILIGTIIGSTLGKGTIAIFNLTNNVQSLPLGIFGIALVSAAFPHMSDAFNQKDFEGMSMIFYKTASKILFLLIPAGVFMFVLRQQIITLILSSGKFTQEDAFLSSVVLAFFCVSIFSQGLTPLVLRFYYSLHDTIIPFIVNLICITINVIASYLFVKILNSSNRFYESIVKIFNLGGFNDISVIGLAMGFSFTSWINLIILYILLHGKIKNLYVKEIFKTGLKYLIASVIAGIGMYFISNLLPAGNLFLLSLNIGLSGCAGIFVYILVSWILKSEELKLLLKNNQK